MNPRIRELAAQAKQCALSAMIKIADKEQALRVYSESYDATFAELIVRECAEELKSSQRGDPYTGELYDCEYNTCIKEQCEMLKECFGVEE